MPKLQIEATELTETDVSFVSLVKRGANRIPFRITKSEENEMIDLHKIGRGMFKKAETKPGIFAAIVQKNDQFEANKAILAKAGITVEEGVEKDGIVTFAQKGVTEFETGVVKLNDDVAIVVSGLMKSFSGYDFDSVTFTDVMSTGGFMPSMCLASDLLGCTVGNILSKADNPATAADQIGAAIDDFKSFAVSLAKGLPVQAFKADTSLVRKSVTVDVTAEKPPLGDEPGGPKVDDTSGGVKRTEDDRNTAITINIGKAEAPENVELTAAEHAALWKGDKKPTDDELAAAAKAKKAKTPPATAKKEEQQPDLAALIQKSLADGLKTIQTSVAEQIGSVQKDIAGVKTTVTELGTQVAKQEEALNGTVSAAPAGDKTGLSKTEKTNVRKTGAPPLLDTGFMKLDTAA